MVILPNSVQLELQLYHPFPCLLSLVLSWAEGKPIKDLGCPQLGPPHISADHISDCMNYSESQILSKIIFLKSQLSQLVTLQLLPIGANSCHTGLQLEF